LVPNRTYINTGGCGGLSTDDLGEQIFDNQLGDIRGISVAKLHSLFCAGGSNDEISSKRGIRIAKMTPWRIVLF
jgi:hypothetical protein